MYPSQQWTPLKIGSTKSVEKRRRNINLLSRTSSDTGPSLNSDKIACCTGAKLPSPASNDSEVNAAPVAALAAVVTEPAIMLVGACKEA